MCALIDVICSSRDLHKIFASPWVEIKEKQIPICHFFFFFFPECENVLIQACVPWSICVHWVEFLADGWQKKFAWADFLNNYIILGPDFDSWQFPPGVAELLAVLK